MSRKSCFTMVELMVVIAIISILCLLIYPALNNINSKANQLHCSNNLKEIGVAISLYTEEHDGWLPMALDPEPGRFRNGFVGELAPYLGFEQSGWLQKSYAYQTTGAPDVLSCPSETYEGKILGYGWNWLRLGSYRRNEWGRRRHISEIQQPKTQSIVGESRSIGTLGTTLWWGGNYFRERSEYYFGNRHEGRANYILVDGHYDQDDYLNLINRQSELILGN